MNDMDVEFMQGDEANLETKLSGLQDLYKTG